MHPNRPAVAMPSGTPAGDTRQSRVGDRHLERGGGRGRPAGVAGRWKEGNGLTGVVGAPTPAAGSSQVLSPAQDVAAIWPDLVAIDNCFYGLSFVARSPKRTAVADVRVASVTYPDPELGRQRHRQPGRDRLGLPVALPGGDRVPADGDQQVPA